MNSATRSADSGKDPESARSPSELAAVTGYVPFSLVSESVESGTERAEWSGRSLRVAYADPPYVGESKQHYGNHPDYAGEVNHAELVQHLLTEYPDGWALSMKTATLREVLNLCHDAGKKVRVGVWCKRNAALKKHVNPAYAWEPVVFFGGRKRRADGDFLLDWIDCAATFGKRPVGGKIFVGRKPEKFCVWVFGMLGLKPCDELDDIYPGTGSVGDSFAAWRSQAPLWNNCDGSLPDEVSGCGGTSERSTNKPAHVLDVMAAAGRADDACAQAMAKWVADQRKVDAAIARNAIEDIAHATTLADAHIIAHNAQRALSGGGGAERQGDTPTTADKGHNDQAERP